MSSNLQYRKTLKRISDELRVAELGRLKQLCAEEIPTSKREQAKTGQQLFTFMEEQGLIERGNLNYLIGLLERIQRHDIVSKCALRASERELPRRKTSVKLENSFRSLVDVLSEGLTSRELSDLRDLCVDEIPGGRRQYLTDPQSFLTELESRGSVGSDNLDFLVELMEIIQRNDLVNVVKTFQNKGEVVRPTGAGGHALTLGRQPPVVQYASEPQPERMESPRETTLPIEAQDSDAHAPFAVAGNSSPSKKKTFRSEDTNKPRSSYSLQPKEESQYGCSESGTQLANPTDDQPPTMTSTNVSASSYSSMEEGEKQSIGTDRRTAMQLESVDTPSTDSHRIADLLRQLDEKSHMLRQAQIMNCEALERKEQEKREALERKEQEKREQEASHQREVALLQSSAVSSRDVCLPCYSMMRNPRGLAVIISIETFQRSELNLGSRQGTSQDVRNLNSTFKRLQFDVKIHRDCSSVELVRAMTDYGVRDHSNYDCFVCCLLTHGKKDFLYGSDSTPVSISEITSKVNGLACPSLNNKPKLFFIQACRGTGEDKGIETDALPRIAHRDAQEQVKIPLGADFLIGYSTPPETVSFRSTTHGSWYICTLTAVLNEYANRSMSLTDMLILVNHRLAQATTSEGLKQIPSPINQLTKQVIFTPTSNHS